MTTAALHRLADRPVPADRYHVERFSDTYYAVYDQVRRTSHHFICRSGRVRLVSAFDRATDPTERRHWAADAEAALRRYRTEQLRTAHARARDLAAAAFDARS